MNLNEALKGIAFYSLGVGTVSADKLPSSDEILVYLPTNSPADDGEVVANMEQVVTNVSREDGSTHSVTVLNSNVVPATWFRGESNRLTSPDVRRGTKVMVYKFVGSNTLRWTTCEYDQRALEKVILGFNGNPNIEETAELSYDDYYILEINTMEGRVSFRTSMANDEPAKYAVEFNTKSGLFLFNDSEEFNMYLDTMNHDFTIINKEQSVFNMNKEVVSISTKDTVNIYSEKQINVVTKELNITSHEDTNLLVGNDININIGSDVNCDVGGNVRSSVSGNVTTKIVGDRTTEISGNSTINVNGNVTSKVSGETNHTCAMSTITGNLNVNGNIGLAGNITCSSGSSGGGDCTISSGSMDIQKGSLNIGGSLTVAGDAVIGGKSFLSHTHNAPDGTTSPPL